MAFDGRVISNVGVLAAIIESGGFSRAAETLGLSPSGVSRAISRLEARIGVRLLDRNTRSVSLTDEGRRFFENVAPLLNGIENAVVMTAGAAETVRGRLRVNVDAFFARMMLAPHVARFMDMHPDIALELVVKDQLGDLVGEGFDIAVRFGEPPESSLIARKLAETRTITVAARAYLEKHGTPANPNDLAQHECILVRNSLTGQLMRDWHYRRNRKTLTASVHGRLVVNEAGTLLGACLAGAGIARMKAIGIRDQLAAGELIELLPDWQCEGFPLYALYPSRHLPAAKVRAFIDFVVTSVLEPTNN
ncbi:LysR family transcriptional regulator [Dyella psychrodurans]|uniref:LysR family transcriptional regulator n=1 Tax=Dyella psychrodurans TaxID=1927960 RepID=A0A370XEF1_9GAMM|nr:LysR family transcriptional regulator [Dyella psychrodurans]RDS86682.1 LysR family transcriptional regulator [Dyella psychrodurans]